MSNRKILQMVSAQPGWFSFFNDEHGEYCCEIAFFLLCEEDGETFVSAVSDGFDSDLSILDHEVSNFMLFGRKQTA